MIKTAAKRARCVMIQATGSHAGKSLLTAALCRILRQMGFSVAPFKAQNMALNAFVTMDGGEIGMAQALQAQAAGIEPSVDMNPVLLKPSADSVCQVIVQGRVHSTMSARQYHGFKAEAKKFVKESYARLARLHDVIVIEGAGSPAEINLRRNDIANMGMAAIAKSPVIIVGDIDRGGVFASLAGTVDLLAKTERARVAGFVINKFRGDIGLLKPGLAFLKKKTGISTLGIVPYVKDVRLPDEDSFGLETAGKKTGAKNAPIRLKIIKLPRISNFTDFDPFKSDPDVEMEFIDRPDKIKGADMIVIPGSKNTIQDLSWLKENGFNGQLFKGFVKRGGMLAGVCGGFQMLGKTISDPHGVESSKKGAVKTEALCLIDGHTVLKKEKKTFRVKAVVVAKGLKPGIVEGYEIHMGLTECSGPPLLKITRRNGRAVKGLFDGASANGGMVWGTYMHGIFDNADFRRQVLNKLRLKKRLGVLKPGESHLEATDAAIDGFSAVVKDNIDMKKFFKIIGLPMKNKAAER